MTREQIEKAAGEYSGSVFGFKDNPVVMNKHKAFMDGAEWRINSVWHNVYERPDSGRMFLYIGKSLEDRETKFDTDYLYPNENWEDFVFGEAMEEWAYIDDLLPERKEEAE